MVSVLPARPHWGTPHVPQRITRSTREEIPAALTRPTVDLELIVPAFNEERRIAKTVACTVDYLARRPWTSAVVVVDNDSADCTLEVLGPFDDAPVSVYVIGCSSHGKGAAVRRGIATSAARFVGFVDADNATPIGTLDRVMALLSEGYAAVIASRRAPGARYEIEQPALRKCGGWMFRRLAQLTLPDIADTQCGFKFFDGPLAREVVSGCHIDGFAFDVELLARLSRNGRAIVEVPVAWSDVPGSTFSARRDGLRSMADLLRISLSR
ncbi:glycosyltransferase [Streptomyces sp. NPDC005408]|uniref:glycosyltransferase n=1 Tax=Streptomyces sp. NPDC005408 TaxID=3155341 RepID=UPI0033AA721C